MVRWSLSWLASTRCQVGFTGPTWSEVKWRPRWAPRWVNEWFSEWVKKWMNGREREGKRGRKSVQGSKATLAEHRLLWQGGQCAQISGSCCCCCCFFWYLFFFFFVFSFFAACLPRRGTSSASLATHTQGESQQRRRTVRDGHSCGAMHRHSCAQAQHYQPTATTSTATTTTTTTTATSSKHHHQWKRKVAVNEWQAKALRVSLPSLFL